MLLTKIEIKKLKIAYQKAIVILEDYYGVDVRNINMGVKVAGRIIIPNQTTGIVYLGLSSPNINEIKIHRSIILNYPEDALIEMILHEYSHRLLNTGSEARVNEAMEEMWYYNHKSYFGVGN